MKLQHLPMLALALISALPVFSAERRTAVSIDGAAFHINGEPAYAGVAWKGIRSRSC